MLSASLACGVNSPIIFAQDALAEMEPPVQADDSAVFNLAQESEKEESNSINTEDANAIALTSEAQQGSAVSQQEESESQLDNSASVTEETEALFDDIIIEDESEDVVYYESWLLETETLDADALAFDESIQEGICGEHLIWTMDQNGNMTISGTGNMTNYTLDHPSEFAQLCAQYDTCTLTVEEGVTGIGNYAFYNCKNLVAMHLPEGLLQIGWNAFSYTGLRSVELPRKLEYLNGSTFSYCTALEEVIFPSNAVFIHSYNSPFTGCTNLHNVYVRNINTSMSQLNPEMFGSNSNLTIYGYSHPGDSSRPTEERFALSYGKTLYMEVYETVLRLSDHGSNYESVQYTTYNRTTGLYDTKQENDAWILDEGDILSTRITETTGATRSLRTYLQSHLECDDAVTSSFVGKLFYEKDGSIHLCVYTPYAENGIIGEGVCGNSVRWKFDEEGTMTVYCTASTPMPMSDYSAGWDDDYTGGRQYEKYISMIKQLVIEPNVSTVGNGAFSDCTNLTQIELGVDIKKIGAYAFSCCTSLSEISIPDEVTDVEEGAFSRCGELKKINLSSSIGRIADRTFYQCYQLQDILIPEGVTEIGKNAFESCSKLQTIYIPASVTKIEVDEFGSYPVSVFWDCSQLTNIEVSNENETYASFDGLLYNKDLLELIRCPEGKEEIVFPQKLERIGDGAFHGCSKLEQVILPNTVTEIGDSAFNGCGLHDIAIPDSVSSIGDYAFRRINSTELIIPESVLKIGADIVYLALENMILVGKEGSRAEGYAHEASYTFAKLISARTLSWNEELNLWINELDHSHWKKNEKTNEWMCLDESDNEWVSWMDEVKSEPGYETDQEYTFKEIADGSTAVLYVYERKEANGDVSQLCNAGTCGEHLLWEFDEESETLTISGTGEMTDYYTPVDGSITPDDSPFVDHDVEYRNASMMVRHVVIEEGVESIGAFAFYECPTIEDIQLPEKMTRIGHGAFSNCNSIKQITIPSGVERIEDIAFNSCDELADIKFEGAVESIGDSAFSGCWSLKTIELPEGLIEVGDKVFNGCSALISIKFPSSLEQMGELVFYDCENLQWIEVAPGNQSFRSQDGVLYDAEGKNLLSCPAGRESVEIDSNVEQISAGAFSYCHKLKEIKLPDGLRAIGDRAFECCNSLESITLPGTVEQLGEMVFWNCEELENVKLSEAITVIPEDAFSNCNKLKTITLPKSLKRIEECAFGDCDIQSIAMPEGVEYIGPYAFRSNENLTGTIILKNAVTIDTSAFECCRRLEHVEFDNALERIGDGAFYQCSMLSDVILPHSVRAIGKLAFSGCVQLGSILIPASVEEMGKAVLRDCSELKIICYPDTFAAEYAEQYSITSYSLTLKYDSSTGKYTDDQGNEWLYEEGSAELPKRVDANGNTSMLDIAVQLLGKSKDELQAGYICVIHVDSSGNVSFEYRGRLGERSGNNEQSNRSSVNGKAGTQPNSSIKTGSSGAQGGLKASVPGTFTLAPGKASQTITLTGLEAGDSVRMWLSSNPKVAKVSKTGKITALKTGTVKIAVITNKGKTLSFTVQVKKPSVSVSRKKVKLRKGQRLKITASGLVSGDRITSWKSSSKKVVTVKNGVLRAKKKGTAKITVKTKFGAKVTIKVTVKG